MREEEGTVGGVGEKCEQALKKEKNAMSDMQWRRGLVAGTGGTVCGYARVRVHTHTSIKTYGALPRRGVEYWQARERWCPLVVVVVVVVVEGERQTPAAHAIGNARPPLMEEIGAGMAEVCGAR
jgi:hypothetical protein